MNKVIGWARVSVSKPLEHQKYKINQYCEKNGLEVGEWFETKVSTRKTFSERRIVELMDIITSEHTVIMTDLSRLGRSVKENLELLDMFLEKNCRVILIKESIDFRGELKGIQKMQYVMISSFAELERERHSENTKEALASLKAKGIKLGAPKGKLQKSVLDDKKDEIVELLAKRISVQNIQRLLGGCSYNNYRLYIKSRNLMKEALKLSTKV